MTKNSKYSLFNGIVGQERALGILRSILETGKTHHAYAFTGPEGVGKHDAARAFAASLCCAESGCGSCSSCRRFLEERFHPDMHFLSPPEGKRFIPVESVREIQKILSLSHSEAAGKVLIINPADRMTEAASNALLKTLEEPPESTYIILVSSRPWHLLSTIRSRCQRIRFAPLDASDIMEILSSQGTYNPDALSAAAVYAQGSLSRAQNFLEHDMNDSWAGVKEFFNAIQSENSLEAVNTASAAGRDRDEAIHALELFLFTLHGMLRQSAGAGRFILPFDSALEVDQYDDDASFLLDAMELALRALENIDRNQHHVLTLESMLITIRDRKRRTSRDILHDSAGREY